MLEALRITNYAIIDQLEVEFDKGLTVITGETGAGKSVILGAFRVLLGERATAERVRTGTKRAGIEGIFRIGSKSVTDWLEDNGLLADDPDDSGSLVLRREIVAEGTSRNFINGRSATVAQLKELGVMLVDMHGQNDHTRLHSPVVQLQVLDSFGEYTKELEVYRAAYQEWRSARSRYDALSSDQGDAERRRDFLQFQVAEIQEAGLKAGEDENLEQERRRLGSAEKLQEICSEVCDLLYDGDRNDKPAANLIAQAARSLQELAKLDPSQESLAADIESLRFAVEDLAEKVRDYGEQVAGDPERLDLVENRLELLRTLKRKYGGTLEEVITTGEKLGAELNDIVNHDAALAEAAVQLETAEKQAASTAAKLSQSRQKAARNFEKLVQENMRELELPKAVLKIQLEAAASQEKSSNGRPVFQTSGQDACEFLVSLNAGETPKPMRKVASGGEISRIMLAIKSVLAHRDRISTLIFDEIDTGISGQAATRVGEKLEQLSQSHQIMCITHLPQVAARGASHLVVEKTAVNDRTVTGIKNVTGEERTLALARMLSGAEVDETSKRFAEKLLVR